MSATSQPFDIDRYHRLRHTTELGARVEYRDSTGSTMDDARAFVAAESGMAPGLTCVAGEQLRGRGRLGRQWVSSPGVGLYVTFYVQQEVVASASLVTLAAALAVRDAIAHVSPLSLDVKWPNDLMYRGRKVSGILAEAQTTAGRLDVFLGIGINLKPDPELPPEVARLATSISEAGGGEPGMESLLAALVDALEPRLREVDENPAQILGDWRARLSTLGQDVTVQLFEGSVRGRAIDVGAGGELVLALPGGGTRLISAGDVVVAPPPADASGIQSGG